ncbi:MAG TPA: hypothetical protein VFB67_03040 [Candidatus Polarisedimenticolaceae bacterium]|nr:hypothetical protein [Candidatus Polarisedimenticolaceae bacterium]
MSARPYSLGRVVNKLAATVGVMGALACAPAARPAPSTSPPPALIELWDDPRDLESRDLLIGRGGPALVPDPKVEYRLEALDTKGHSKGYEVVDPSGRKWDVKIGDEAQSEVAVSRILWAIGYRQPVVHYVARWRLSGGPTATPAPGRFRFKGDHKSDGEWSWKENPFVGTRPLRGLVIVNILLNNWDLAASQNRVYRLHDDQGSIARWYVVQDLGAALGKPRWPLGSRNDIEGFEARGFVRGADGDHVDFDYGGRHKDLLKDATVDDVVWACRLLARLSDKQLDDAFRAAGYTDDLRERFVRHIRMKIGQGLALDRKR